MDNNLSNSKGSSKKNVSKVAEIGIEAIGEMGKGFGGEVGKGAISLTKAKIENNSKERMQKADLEAKKEIEIIKNMDKEERAEYMKYQERIKKDENKTKRMKYGVLGGLGLSGLGCTAIWIVFGRHKKSA